MTQGLNPSNLALEPDAFNNVAKLYTNYYAFVKTKQNQ